MIVTSQDPQGAELGRTTRRARPRRPDPAPGPDLGPGRAPDPRPDPAAAAAKEKLEELAKELEGQEELTRQQHKPKAEMTATRRGRG